jgi:hypothetical protein
MSLDLSIHVAAVEVKAVEVRIDGAPRSSALLLSSPTSSAPSFATAMPVGRPMYPSDGSG